MRILITGAKGMLGRTLTRHLKEHELLLADLDTFDLADRAACEKAVREFGPETILHTAAMTQVDRCETEAEAAHRNNVAASANIAHAANAGNARLIAFSTDYVFSGDSDRPYREDDAPAPRTVYGKTKLEAEQAIASLCQNHLICRLAWLYGPGGPSFVHTMLKLGKEDGAPLRVVNDQIGNPTSTDAVADKVEILLQTPATGIMHLTCEGEATWMQFTQEIFAIKGLTRPIVPCRTEEYPRPAPRPANSRLEKGALAKLKLPPMPDWREALRDFFIRYPEGV